MPTQIFILYYLKRNKNNKTIKQVVSRTHDYIESRISASSKQEKRYRRGQIWLLPTELYYIPWRSGSYTCFSNRSVARNMADFDVN